MEEVNVNKTDESDLVFTAKLMKKYTNQQSMIRDLYCFVMNRKKGIKAEMIPTGNDYIDDIVKFIVSITK